MKDIPKWLPRRLIHLENKGLVKVDRSTSEWTFALTELGRDKTGLSFEQLFEDLESSREHQLLTASGWMLHIRPYVKREDAEPHIRYVLSIPDSDRIFSLTSSYITLKSGDMDFDLSKVDVEEARKDADGSIVERDVWISDLLTVKEAIKAVEDRLK